MMRMYTINIAVNFIPIMMFNRKYFGIYYLVGDIRSDKWSFMHEENMGMFSIMHYFILFRYQSDHMWSKNTKIINQV